MQNSPARAGGVELDLDTTFQVRDARSKTKCLRFFGEAKLPIVTGAGSTAKLSTFFGARAADGPQSPRSPRSPRSPATPESPLLPPTPHAARRARSVPSLAALALAMGGESSTAPGPVSASASPAETLSSPARLLPSRPASPTSPPRAARDASNIINAAASTASTPTQRQTPTFGTANAMLLAAGEPQSPASHAQALIDERAALGRGEELSISAWQRRGSESNTTLSSLAPEQLGADRLTWLQEAREHDPTLSAAVDAIAGNFRRAPRPMSEDTLLERALHRSSSVSSTSARTSVSSYSALLRNISAQHLAAESGAGPSAAPAPTSLRPPLPEMSSRAAARNKLSVDTLTSVDVPSAATELTPTRASVSSRKITAIFGEACPVDISTTQIERKGLWALLLSNLPLCYFLLYLLRKHTAEILFFVLDAHDFEQTVFESNTQLQRSAQDLFGLYLAKDALFELNVSHKVRRAVADGIQSSSLSCFARAQQEMMRLLDESFTEFKGSAEFAQMKRELGPHSVMHHESTATHVAQMLRSAVPAQVKALGDHRKRQLMAVRGRVDILIDDCLTPYFFARPQLRA